jgi:hypothetical protein
MDNYIEISIERHAFRDDRQHIITSCPVNYFTQMYQLLKIALNFDCYIIHLSILKEAIINPGIYFYY